MESSPRVPSATFFCVLPYGSRLLKPQHRITWCFPGGDRVDRPGYSALNLLGHAEIDEFVLPQACGGQAECGTCRVQVVSGAVTPSFGDELELRARHPKSFDANERLACRARPRGDLVVVLRGRAPADLRDSEE